MSDLKNPKVIRFKGFLFLVAGLFASLLLIAQTKSWTTAFLLVVAVWSFCRLYYFLFYVIEHYVDRNARYSGLVPMILYLCSAQTAVQAETPAPIKIAQNIADSDLDRHLLRITERTEMTDEVQRGVLAGLALLPPDVKRSFANAGITVTITPSLERFGDAGGKGTEYSPRLHSVIICERNKDGTPTDLRRLPITVLHELGHAFDQLLGYPSRQQPFRQIYTREAPNVTAQDHPRLAYFVDDPTTGPRETFASLFACKYFRSSDKRLDALKQTFPDAFNFVDKLRL